jgi:lycopene cyclase domain-containing protein
MNILESHWLYLFINLAVISIPLLLSFDRKVGFYKLWKGVLPAILAVATVFLIWDVWFTHQGHWGFDDRYIGSIRPLGLPLGEWLFFFTVPYACLFVHYALKAYFGQMVARTQWKYVLWILILGAISLLALYGSRPYTLWACVPAIGLSAWLLTVRPDYLQQLSFAFVICLLPFLLVNGLLTGSFLEGQVVWYSPSAFSGIRIRTIPLEDVFYAFDLLGLNIIISERLLRRSTFVS